MGASAPGAGTFTGFGDPAISGCTVAFFGTTTLAQGIYTADARTLARIADTTTAIPATHATRIAWKSN
jgi:hypothetical protein